MTATAKKFHVFEDAINSALLERAEEAHTATLALASREHHFSLGIPGVGKSMLADVAISLLAQVKKFDILMTRYSQPEEVVGGPDVHELMEGRGYKRVTRNMLPEADIAFFDEVFKANSAILNALLKIMNERKFVNGDESLLVPLITMFAASNELPTSDELAAVYDRFLFKHMTTPIMDSSNFIKLLKMRDAEPQPPVLTKEDLGKAAKEIGTVEVTDDVLAAVKQLRDELKAVQIEPTDRKWRASIKVVRAEAWYHGRSVAQRSDLRPLIHVLWQTVDDIKTVKGIVLQIANPAEREISDLYDKLMGAYAEYKKSMTNEAENAAQRAALTIEIYGKIEKAKVEFKRMERKLGTSEKPEIMKQLAAKLVAIGQTVLSEVNPDSVDDLVGEEI